MIGAGSVVTKDVGCQELWYGNPAKKISNVCKCGQKCDNRLICDNCKGKKSMIPFLDLKTVNAQYREELINACTKVIDSV